MKQLLLDFTPPPARTFANFVVGNNGELVERLKTLCRLAPGSDGAEQLYIWGGPQTGKTHLLNAAAAASEWPVLKMTADALRVPDSRSLVLVDDVEQLTARAQQALFNLVNSHAFSALIVVGNAAPRHLEMREDLTTRLGAGHVYQLQALADTDKAAALVAHAVGRGFELKREVAEYLVTRFARDMGSLVTVLDQLDQFSLESQRPVTLPLVRAAVAARAAH